MPDTNMCEIYAIFHLNLAFSSVDIDDHPNIISNCYWPLLRLIEDKDIPLGIELSIYTLECIAKNDTHWIDTLKTLVHQNKCEVLACGDSQIIGPLVPADVNQKNIELGLRGYREWLDISPQIAYVNEQAVSMGLLDLYIDAGFKAVVIEWDNPYSHNSEWSRETQYKPQNLLAKSGKSIPVIWNHAIAFQKLQRFAHGEYAQQDYLDYLDKVVTSEHRCFSIYGNDAEIFDYRPGRFKAEPKAQLKEWKRLSTLFTDLSKISKFQWKKPLDVLKNLSNSNPLKLANSAHPISVKKQAKYNIARWAVSGRNDLHLNSSCFKALKALRLKNTPEDIEWKKLCRLWASDLRTHLTEKRYADLPSGTDTPSVITSRSKTVSKIKNTIIHHDALRHRLIVNTRDIKLVLNTYRGLSIDTLAFKDHGFIPICGTLSQGHFDHIGYSADFYSNHVVMELFRDRERVTDLNPSTFDIYQEDEDIVITVQTPALEGGFTKWYRLRKNELLTGFSFSTQERQECSLRLGYITLLNSTVPCWYSAHLGGRELEFFEATNDFDHGAPVSALISSNSAVSATEGICFFGSASLGVELNWDTARCAPLAMISSKKIKDQFLNRFYFSLIEADETLKPGGYLPHFEFSIKPSSIDNANP